MDNVDDDSKSGDDFGLPDVTAPEDDLAAGDQVVDVGQDDGDNDNDGNQQEDDFSEGPEKKKARTDDVFVSNNNDDEGNNLKDSDGDAGGSQHQPIDSSPPPPQQHMQQQMQQPQMQQQQPHMQQQQPQMQQQQQQQQPHPHMNSGAPMAMVPPGMAYPPMGFPPMFMMNPQMYGFNPYYNPNGAAGYGGGGGTNDKSRKDANGENKEGEGAVQHNQNYMMNPAMNPAMNPPANQAMMYNPYMMQHFQGMMNSFYPRPGFPPMFNQNYPTTNLKKGISLSLSIDGEMLSEYQLLVRQQLELFEAGPEDVESNTQGRKKQVVVGQVGLRCKHCAPFPLRARGRGAVYYPAKLSGIYQAAQNMAGSHLCQSCQQIPMPTKAELLRLRERRDNASGGKQYWADGCLALGVYETEHGLRLGSQPNTGGKGQTIVTKEQANT